MECESENGRSAFFGRPSFAGSFPDTRCPTLPGEALAENDITLFRVANNALHYSFAYWFSDRGALWVLVFISTLFLQQLVLEELDLGLVIDFSAGVFQMGLVLEGNASRSSWLEPLPPPWTTCRLRSYTLRDAA